MSDPFLGEIRMVGFNFAPRGWALCDGQILPIPQNTALFALLGTTFGGNGSSTFGLPDFQGRSPVGVGNGPGLNTIAWGEKKGRENVTLLEGEMPRHTHTVTVAGKESSASAMPSKTNNVLGASTGGPGSAAIWSNALNAPTALSPNQVATAGESQPFNIRNPFTGVYFIIAMQGVFPPRN